MRFWDRKCKKNKRFIENLIIDWVIVMIVKGYCMKKTLFIILSFVYFALACYSSDNAAPIPKLNQNEIKALNLAIEQVLWRYRKFLWSHAIFLLHEWPC